MITVIAGGVGAAKLLRGLVELIPPEEVTVIVNTGDDIELYGLHVSPDLDIITYTLAGLVNEKTGWGIKNDTFHCLESLGKYGLETWFNLGDRDLATHIYRTALMKTGLTLTQATDRIRKNLGVKSRIIPMTDSPVTSRIKTDRGIQHFEEYLVKYKASDTVRDVRFDGIEEAEPSPGVIESIKNSGTVIIAPSNPIVSIGPILAVEGVKAALTSSRAKRIAVSPIISGSPVKGPADKLMSGLNMEVSSLAVAGLYRKFLDLYVLDLKDRKYKDKIADLGLDVVVTDTLMIGLESKVRVARTILEASFK